jgi:cell wall-associated NlpC family hydrolase
MTRTPPTRTHVVARRLAVAVAVTTVTLGAMVGPVEASPVSTSSDVLAAQANIALYALDRWEVTGDVNDYTDFVRARAQVVQGVASELDVDPEAIQIAWSNVSFDKQHIVLSAMSQLGVPYRSRMSKAGRGFDCSGLVLFAYAQAGFELPRSSRDQFRAADEIAEYDAQPGDLVYYPGHISLYLGAGLMVHSPNSGNTVEVRPLFDRSLRFADAIDVQSETDQ